MNLVADAPLSRGVRWLGCADYASTLAAMVAFTEQREPRTPDEIWMCEHMPVYTQGVAGRNEHVFDVAGVPLIRTQRGGQVTYHGPGQVVAYPLIDLRRLGIYVKEYVYRLEHAALATLASYGVTGHRMQGAPGIYVRLDDPFGHAVLPGRAVQKPADAAAFQGLGKIAALGIKVSRHCTYHGLALNVRMDLAPFTRIAPCGYRGLAAIDLATLGVLADPVDVAHTLAARLASYLELHVR